MAEGGRGENHPSPGDLERFLLGEMSPRQAGPVVIHLVRGCALCVGRMAPLASAMFAHGPLAPPPSQEPYPEYDFPLFKAFAAARRYEASRALGENPRRRLPRQAFPKVVPAPLISAADPRRRYEALLKLCRSLRHSDPEGMTLAASLAVVLSERMDAIQVGEEAKADLQARAWAELGNAYRVSNDLTSAEAALAHAQTLSGRGTGNPLLLAQLMDLTASLYNDQRRFEEARRLIDWVYATYLHVGDTHLAARALISKGISLNLASESEEAMDLLTRGIPLLDSSRDPKLMFAAIHALLWCLVDCGQAGKAAALLNQSRNLYAAFDEPLLALRARWLEGRIDAGSGDETSAEQAFLQVRKGFQEVGLPVTAAAASLDLAAVWLRQGRTAEIKELVDEMVTIFRALNIQREPIAALLMLRDALRKNQAAAALLQAARTEVQRLERLPRPRAT